MRTIRWCCATFKAWYENAGGRNIAILVGRDRQAVPEFILQHRAIEGDLQGTVFTESPLSLVSEVRILFCPWCGRNLREWYSRDIDELYRPGFKIFVKELDGSTG